MKKDEQKNIQLTTTGFYVIGHKLESGLTFQPWQVLGVKPQASNQFDILPKTSYRIYSIKRLYSIKHLP